MHVEITLGGALIQYLPKDKSGNSFTFVHESSLSVSALLGHLGIGPDQRLLTILNGQVVQPQAFTDTLLKDGDVLSLMPPIVAG